MPLAGPMFSCTLVTLIVLCSIVVRHLAIINVCLALQAQKEGSHGTVYWVSGERYQGAWRDNQRHGEKKEEIRHSPSSIVHVIVRARMQALAFMFSVVIH